MNMDNNFMRLHGARMADAGYCITPIATGQKWPGEYVNGKWEHKRGWEFLRLTPTPEPLINIWENYPGCGVGIVTGGYSRVIGVDIDVLDAEIAGAIRRKIEEKLGPTPLVRVGKAPKVLLVYRCTEKIDKLSYQPIEVLANGQQFVAYGVHPDTGLPYTWPDESPSETSVDSLPQVSPELLRSVIEEAYALVPEELRPKRLQSSDGGQHTAGDQAKATPEAIREALKHIPNPDLSWDDWKRVLMATFAASNGSEEAYFDFLGWSRKSTKHKDADTRREWTSCKASPPRSLGFGTLHYLAKQQGWVPSAGLNFNVNKDTSNVDTSGFDNMPMQQSSQDDFNQRATMTAEEGPAVIERIVGHAGEGNYVLSSLPSGTPIYEYEYIDGGTCTGSILPPKGLFYPASLFAGQTKTANRWLVQDVIPRRKVTLLSGDGGTGKSLLALQLAAAVATGGEWLGQAVEKGRALFLTAEDEDQDLRDRMLDVAAASGISLTAYSNLLVRSVAGEDTALVEFPQIPKRMQPTRLLVEVEKALQEAKPALLVLDTLGNLFPGNENDRSQVVPFVSQLYSLAMKHDTTILLLGHPSLSGLTTGRGSSGSTAWNNSVRSRLYLENPSSGSKDKEEEAEYSPNQRRLTVMKSNYGLSGRSLMMTWKDGYFVRDEDEQKFTNDAGEVVSKGDKAKEVFLTLLEKFCAEGRHVSTSSGANFAPSAFEKHPEACGIKRQSFRRAMDSLMSEGQIKQIVEGPPSRRRARLIITEKEAAIAAA